MNEEQAVTEDDDDPNRGGALQEIDDFTEQKSKSSVKAESGAQKDRLWRSRIETMSKIALSTQGSTLSSRIIGALSCSRQKGTWKQPAASWHLWRHKEPK